MPPSSTHALPTRRDWSLPRLGQTCPHCWCHSMLRTSPYRVRLAAFLPALNADRFCSGFARSHLCRAMGAPHLTFSSASAGSWSLSKAVLGYCNEHFRRIRAAWLSSMQHGHTSILCWCLPHCFCIPGHAREASVAVAITFYGSALNA